MSVPDEQVTQLMHAAQHGDAEAYVRLLETIVPRVRHIIERRRGFAGRDTVEDLVQDVLLSVHAVRASYDPARPFGPWLMAIVRNRLADGARRYARRTAREVAVGDLDVTFPETAANTGVDASGDVEALAVAINGLPPGQRQAIELLKLQELSLKEAAAKTGSSVAALKVATHRAIASLRRTLMKRSGFRLR